MTLYFVNSHENVLNRSIVVLNEEKCVRWRHSDWPKGPLIQLNAVEQVGAIVAPEWQFLRSNLHFVVFHQLEVIEVGDKAAVNAANVGGQNVHEPVEAAAHHPFIARL